LHASALTLNQINPGCVVIHFNIHVGVLATYEVMSRPVVRQTASGSALMVELKNLKTGERKFKYLMDMGVVPLVCGVHFNRANFTIHQRKRHLLPTKLVRRPKRPRLQPSRRSHLSRLRRWPYPILPVSLR